MKVFKILALAIVLASCGTAGRKQSGELQKFIQSGEYKKAESYVNSEKFYPEMESRLLKLVELGTIQYLNGHYYQALGSFNKAKELSDKLFTVSISKKLKAAVSNSNYDNYYGEKFERSMIRYYQALTHYALSQVGEYEAHEIVSRDKEGKVVKKKAIPLKKLSDKEKRFHLSGAKNVLIEWNSLLDNYKATTGGVVTYKDDLLAKVFGAFIHEQFGSKQERRVALDLYVAAKKVLFKNFNTLETYNKKSTEFKKDFTKLPKMPLAKVKANYVEETEHAKKLLAFLDERINALKKGARSNLFVMIEKGFITPKKAKKFDFPLPLAGLKVDVGGFVGFSTNVLSLAAGSVPKIYFELPEIPYEPVQGEFILHVKKEGKTLKKKSMAVVNPLANLATMIIDQDSTSEMAKVGARVAGKHLTALLAAYGTYTIAKKKMGDYLALTAASLTYAGANKAIEQSERADLRNWSLLPHHYRLASMNLPPGTYDLVLEKVLGDTRTETLLKTVTIEAKKDVNMLAFRTF